ncbi:hypothetical protein NC652_010384 [Populus alba x Populus x berolinensis]|nr:hypothetical protein NC652_010384 [Populus alba x Populus x berolinensis]
MDLIEKKEFCNDSFKIRFLKSAKSVLYFLQADSYASQVGQSSLRVSRSLLQSSSDIHFI